MINFISNFFSVSFAVSASLPCNKSNMLGYGLSVGPNKKAEELRNSDIFNNESNLYLHHTVYLVMCCCITLQYSVYVLHHLIILLVFVAFDPILYQQCLNLLSVRVETQQ